MYPRNNAAPEPIAIGPVVQISDGAVQTSGCTVRIKPIGVAEGDGGGTTAYSTDGVVLYTPTQGETNYTSFVLIAKKTGCIPAAITVVTTESAVAGRVSLGSILGVAITGTAAQLAAAFTKFFNVATPTGTVNSLPDAAPDAAGGLPISDAGGLDLDAKLAATNEVTAARMGALTDWIDGGRLDLILDAKALSSEVTGLNVNTRANVVVPVEIEIPDASTQVYKIRLFLFDVQGNMEAPDSTPTIALVNAAGTDRSSRLSVASNPSTGVYSWDYTATAGDAEEQLNWTFTVVEASATRVYPAVSYVVEETAYRFSSSDRATLNAAATAVELGKVPKSDSNVTWNATALASINAQADLALSDYDPPTKAELDSAIDALPTAAENRTEMDSNSTQLAKLGTPSVSIAADIATRASQTSVDAIPAAVRDVNNTNPAADSLGEAVNAASAPTAEENAAAVWDAVAADHNDAGSMGAKMNSAASAGDPWSTELPGSYANGEAGDILGNLLTDLAAGEIRLINPELGGELKQTTQDMAYNNTLGNRLEWLDINSDWPTLTGGAVTLKIGQGGMPLTFVGSIVTATGANKKVAVELTAVETATIDAANGEDQDAWPYIIYITLSGIPRELRRGRWISTSMPT